MYLTVQGYNSDGDIIVQLKINKKGLLIFRVNIKNGNTSFVSIAVRKHNKFFDLMISQSLYRKIVEFFEVKYDYYIITPLDKINGKLAVKTGFKIDKNTLPKSLILVNK